MIVTHFSAFLSFEITPFSTGSHLIVPSFKISHPLTPLSGAKALPPWGLFAEAAAQTGKRKGGF